MGSVSHTLSMVVIWIAGMCLDRMGILDGVSTNVLFMAQVVCIAVIGFEQFLRWRKLNNDNT